MMAAIQPAVVGATGYAGFELTRLLLRHPSVRTPLLFASQSSGSGADLRDAYPHLQALSSDELPVEPFDFESLKRKGTDLLFLCTPHELSRKLVPQAIETGLKVIDLSGAWRLKDHANREIYKFDEHLGGHALDSTAVYGIPELHRADIASATLVANAGCYATSIILALTPWIKDNLIDLQHGIICDSKSGVSGAGKNPSSTTHFVEVADNLSAYAVFGHRHTGEILEQLELNTQQLQFTPHLLPIPRGILSTIYLRPRPGVTGADLEQSLRAFYSGQPFVRVFGNARLPQIKFSRGTNYCDIGFSVSPDGSRIVLISCLDNLLKGAAGQAVQNMNIMYGWQETAALQ